MPTIHGAMGTQPGIQLTTIECHGEIGPVAHRLYQLDSETVLNFLNTLPSGTYDRLLVKMMRGHARYLRSKGEGAEADSMEGLVKHMTKSIIGDL